MTKSCKRLIQYVFEELKLHRIEVRCEPLNHKSLKILEGLRFVKEGLLKEAVAHYGKWRDVYLYALLE